MTTYKIDIEALRQVLGDQTRVDLTLFRPRTGSSKTAGTAGEATENNQENPLESSIDLL